MSGPSTRSSKTKVRFILLVTIRKSFSFLQTIEGLNFGLVRMYVTPYHISWIIITLDFVISVGIPMSKNCAPLVADIFLNLYNDIQAEIIEAFSPTSRYIDDLLNIDNPYFEGMVNQIYPHELQLNKANTSDTEALFLDLHLSISNGFVSSKIYDKTRLL